VVRIGVRVLMLRRQIQRGLFEVQLFCPWLRNAFLRLEHARKWVEPGHTKIQNLSLIDSLYGTCKISPFMFLESNETE
jgi:hypothetical protein